ncbi:hypothetical protein KY290_010668 [Solanum tuberosum]|uniref:Retrotransposon gag domain-containing protein n=1 Tax=Solanum tuberosum TaxID=4113 RepID=A0ABQ7VYF3_SOLTU|nr:hypothetical protein KY290_010668 [Solanum tuberosum]
MQNHHGKSKVYLEEGEVDSTWTHQETYRHSHTKMEFPKYEGRDTHGWILKAEKYFQNYQTPNDCKVDVASMYLEGDALDFFAWINSERTIYYWVQLVEVMQENYGPAEFKNPNEHFCSIQQTGSVFKYRQEFAKRAARLCYRCGDKFTPSHRCKPGSFAQLELMQEENHVQGVDDNHNEDITPTDLGKISFHAILGKESTSTLKLQGTFCGHKVLMLVDSDSTHNFVAEEIVTKLGLAVQYIPTFGVQIGNGEIIKCNKVCHDLSLEVSNLVINHDLFHFLFGGADMVLGIQWLASLNTIQANWNELFLIFQLNEKTYKLQGIPQKTLITTSFQSDLEEHMLTRDAMLNLMKANYKHIDLSSTVGQVVFPGRGIDKAHIFHTYSRRKKRRKIGEDTNLHILLLLEHKECKIIMENLKFIWKRVRLIALGRIKKLIDIHTQRWNFLRDALDLFTWINSERTIYYWDELVEVMQENYGHAEFQNPNEHFCSIQQTGSIGLKEDLHVDVRIHKSRSLYKVISLALEYEGKQGLNQSSKVPAWPSLSRPLLIGTSFPTAQESFNFQSSRQPVTRSFQSSSLPNTPPLNFEQQIRREKGLCYRCGDKLSPGHLCKPGTFAQLELMQEENHVQGLDDNQNDDITPTDLGDIFFHAILGKESTSTLKLQGTFCGHKVLMLAMVKLSNATKFVTRGIPQKRLTTTSFQSDLEEHLLTRDAMLNLMKADYKHIDLSSTVGQVVFPGRGTDKAHIFDTYSRRKKRRKIGEDTDLHILLLLEIGQQLTTTAPKSGAIDGLAADVAALIAQRMQNHHGKSKVYLEEGEVNSTWRHQETFRHSHTKMEFPKYEGGDTHGWILKAEKYFQNYQTPNDCKVDVASIYLQGDTLDLFAWINSERTIYYWDELVEVMQENYGLSEFQNTNEHFCSIQQTRSVFDGLKEDLHVDVRIHKSRSVYKAMSLAFEYKGKQGLNQSSEVPTWPSLSRPLLIGTSFPTARESFNFQSSRQPVTCSFQPSSIPNTRPLNFEQQIWREKGLCYHCGDKFTPGHRYKPGTFAQLELMQEENHVLGVDDNQNEDITPTDWGSSLFM